ncbi:MAG: ATP-binding cassette domain-containing protein [Bacilli bacterium]|nr:ATP-binding cassette domain-containing protein [Bacilli bacterium]
MFFIESDTDLKKVISKSGLEKFVYSLPRGLDTLINENGNNISGGEKQRIGIAIALLRNTPFIVYDEPTSNLDNAVAQEIEQKLLDNDQGCIMNTHKLNKDFMLKFDTILVLENGYLVEYGTFNYLINNKKYFYELFYSN